VCSETCFAFCDGLLYWLSLFGGSDDESLVLRCTGLDRVG